MYNSNHKEHYIKYYLTRTQNTTALQPNVFLSGMNRLRVTNNLRSAFPKANICQGQLQTPHQYQ
jgi:hypothetical protein